MNIFGWFKEKDTEVTEISMVVDILTHDLEHRPEDYSCGEHVLRDNKTGFEYWVANRETNAGIYSPYKFNFGSQGVRFHAGLRKWKAANFLSLSKDSAEPFQTKCLHPSAPEPVPSEYEPSISYSGCPDCGAYLTVESQRA